MFKTLSLLLPLLPLVFSAPAPAKGPSAKDLKPWKISDVVFTDYSVKFSFNDPNTKVKTTCTSPSSIPTTYNACDEDPLVQFKFAEGANANNFQLDIKTIRIDGTTYTVSTGSQAVTGNPKKFDVPIQNTYPFTPYQITNLASHSPSGRPGNDPHLTLDFTITDNTVNGQETAQCSAAWLDQPEQRDYQCGNFVFRFTSYTSIREFSLALSHTYFLEPTHSTRVTSSGSATFNSAGTDPNLQCQYGGSGVGNCGLAEGKSPVLVPVTNVIGFNN